MLLPLFNYFDTLWLGHQIRDSAWLFAAIESVHLLGLAIIGGAVLTVDLRMAGILFKRQPLREVARDAQPWLVIGLSIMLTTGVLLMIDEPLRCYYSPAFWAKMIFLAAAILFTFTVRHKVARTDQTRLAPIWFRVVGFASILLWSGVGIGGRGIAFY
jgi:hypothetical protein